VEWNERPDETRRVEHPAGMSSRAAVAIAVLVLLAIDVAPAAAKRKPKPQRCAGATFVVEAAQSPLTSRGATAQTDAVDLDTTSNPPTIALLSGCPRVTARMKAGRKATSVKATWKKGACAGLDGPAKLAGRIDAATCATLTARFVARKA